MECISAGQSYLCYIFYEIAYYDFRLHIRINHVPQPYICDKDLYSNDECPFLHMKATYNL